MDETTYDKANRFANVVLGYLECDGGHGYFVHFNGRTATFAANSVVVCVLKAHKPTLYYANVNEAIEACKSGAGK
jgi:hypothetical protein